MKPEEQQPNCWGYLFVWRPQLREVERWYALPGVTWETTDAPGWLRLKSAQHSGQFLLRLSQHRFVLLGSETRLVLDLLESLNIGWMVTRPPINVHRVAMDMVTLPAEYCLGGIWAKVEGYGASLKTMGMFGTDLAEATLLRELLPRLSCYQVRLRHVTKRAEVITVGARGEIGFRYVRTKDLTEAEAALGFLSRRGYINWESGREPI